MCGNIAVCEGSLLNEAHQDKVMTGEQGGLY